MCFLSALVVQVDYLQQKSRELEMKLKESTLAQDESESKARRFQGRITDLELELADVDCMAKRLQCDKEFVVKAADNELSEAKVRNLFNNCKCKSAKHTSYNT